MIPIKGRLTLKSRGRGTSLHVGTCSHQDTLPDPYLLARVPDHMLDILRMGVEDTDTFVLILFINCRKEKERSPRADPVRVTEQDVCLLAPKCTWRDLDSPSQTHTLLSRLQVARRLPDGAQATDLTSFSWPSRVVTHCEKGRGSKINGS